MQSMIFHFDDYCVGVPFYSSSILFFKTRLHSVHWMSLFALNYFHGDLVLHLAMQSPGDNLSEPALLIKLASCFKLSLSLSLSV